jgi:hypothetical protein
MIDRQQLVRRHNPSHQSFDVAAPFAVGNGEVAFTVDATGLQSFPHHYIDDTPLGTQSHWGWHSFPPPEGNEPRSRLTVLHRPHSVCLDTIHNSL